MDQLEFFDIPSPCIGVCQSGKNGFCVGCFRSRDERLYWVQVTPDVKRKIVKACQRRKKKATLETQSSTHKHAEIDAIQPSLFPE